MLIFLQLFKIFGLPINKIGNKIMKNIKEKSTIKNNKRYYIISERLNNE